MRENAFRTSTSSTSPAPATSRRSSGGSPPRRTSDRYTLLDYEPNLGDALAAADLVLARSGGSIFEVVAAGRPAILVPFPFATADHQSANAEWMRAGGAATVIADAELSPARLRGRGRGGARRRGAAGGDGAPPRVADAARRSPTSAAAASLDEVPGRHGAMSEWSGRRLHFIGIGGAGMSGLALVCARLGATVTGSDRSDSSYMERLRGGGARAGRRPRRRQPARGRRGRRLDRDRRGQPGAGAGARARGRADPPRRAAGRALRREAADRGRRHPRQDDDDRDDGLGAAGDRRRSRLLRRRRGAGARPRRRHRQRRLGRGRVGGRRGRRERRQLPAAAAGGRRRHQRRDGPPHALGLAGRAARGLPQLRRPGPRPGRPGRRGDGLAGNAAARRPASTPRARARRICSWRCPAQHNRRNARAALAAIELAGLDVAAAAEALGELPRRPPPARAEGLARPAPYI